MFNSIQQFVMLPARSPRVPSRCVFLSGSTPNLKRTRMILEKSYNVLLAESGREAIEKVKYEKVDLILLDIAMPIMDGLETFKRMKEADIDIPVIFLTASGYEDDVRTAISLGATNYLKKPFFPDELLKRVALGLEEQ